MEHVIPPIFVVLAEIYDERGEHAAAARTIERGASLVRTRAAPSPARRQA